MGLTHMPGGEYRGPMALQREAPLGRLLARRLAAAVFWIERQMERRRSRRALLRLNDDQLRDIGLSPCDAYREASRHFWE